MYNIDLSKAFDSLNLKSLLLKLNFYGVTDLSLDLLYSYLYNTKQCTLYNNIFSDFISIKQGVPQGSILDHSCSQSTLMTFLLLVICLAFLCTLTTLLLSALLLSSIEMITNTFINKHLGKVSTWMKSNKLVLYSKKTKYMLFHKHNKLVPSLELKINDSSIDQVSTFNFLGLHRNSQLTW